MPEYERIERLGEGNFGEVWLVIDHAFEQKLAVKFVRKSRIIDPTDFYKEPRLLKELQHENIIRVEDAGKTTPDETLYIAMEYLPKGSIKDEFKGRPVPLFQAKVIILNICWALHYAHHVHGSKAIIHRDIKPANILLTEDGKAKLSDFGLATHIPRGGGASPFGYLTHIAPEVFVTNEMNILTDIYALGVTAYRLFNGDAYLPIVDTNEEVRDLIEVGKYPDRNHYRPCIPTALQRVVNKAMHVDPQKRYQSASAFRRALEAVSLHCMWWWKRSKNKRTYTTVVKTPEGKKKFRVRTVVTEINRGRFNIITKKKFPTGTERKVHKDCAKGLSKAKMESQLHKILSRYVTEGN